LFTHHWVWVQIATTLQVPPPREGGRDEATVEEAAVTRFEVSDVSEAQVARNLMCDSPGGVRNHGNECYAAFDVAG
jgi:hypothetical protein